VRAAVGEAGIASTSNQCEHKSCDGGWLAGRHSGGDRKNSLTMEKDAGTYQALVTFPMKKTFV
jgi:hypothetical protein